MKCVNEFSERISCYSSSRRLISEAIYYAWAVILIASFWEEMGDMEWIELQPNDHPF